MERTRIAGDASRSAARRLARGPRASTARARVVQLRASRYGGDHARASHGATSKARLTPRTTRIDRGRRVRPRGDTPHPGGQARCAIEQAGDRDRSVEGAPRRRTAAPASRRQRPYPTRRRTRCRRRPEARRPVPVPAPVSRDPQRPPPRAANRRFASRARVAGARRGDAPRASRALGDRPARRAHQGPRPAQGRPAQGRRDPQARVAPRSSTRAAERRLPVGQAGRRLADDRNVAA